MITITQGIYILLLAVILDQIGEPPEKLHPVVWIGKVVDFFDENLEENRQKSMGAVITATITTMFLIPSIILLQIDHYLMILVLGYLTKTMFSIKSLNKMVRNTIGEDLDTKREKVEKLVSRDVEGVDENFLNSASVESAAENLTDSVVGPLLFFAVFGFPGIVFYRVINTMDAMIGYKNEKYREIGWFTARMDDLINYVPSRISGLLIILVENDLRSYEVIKKHKNIKLNPGWTISAMSGVLNRRISKKNQYDINKDKDFPKNEDIKKSIKIVNKVSIITIIITIIITYLRGILLA